MPQLCPVVQWSVHWAPSQMTWVLVLALGKCCSLETCGKKEMQAPLLGLAKSIYYKTNSSVIDHRGHQNVVGTSVTPSPAPMCHFFVLTTLSLMFLAHFDIICDLLLNRRMATWNLFVLYNKELKKVLMMTSSIHLSSNRS